MDVNTIIQIISTIGFPIAACVALGWFLVSKQEKSDDVMRTVVTAVNSLTVAVNELREEVKENRAELRELQKFHKEE